MPSSRTWVHVGGWPTHGGRHPSRTERSLTVNLRLESSTARAIGVEFIVLEDALAAPAGTKPPLLALADFPTPPRKSRLAMTRLAA